MMKFVQVRLPEEVFEELLIKWPDCTKYQLLQKSALLVANSVRKANGREPLHVPKRGRKKKEARVFIEMRLDDIAAELKVDRAEVIKLCTALELTVISGRVSAEGVEQLLT